jgi:hypothetical protein
MSKVGKVARVILLTRRFEVSKASEKRAALGDKYIGKHGNKTAKGRNKKARIARLEERLNNKKK